MILSDETLRRTITIEIHKDNGKHAAIVRTEEDLFDDGRTISECLQQPLRDIVKELDADADDDKEDATEPEVAEGVELYA